MTYIEWRPSFATGIPDVDHEHQEMIEWINRTLAACGQAKDQAGGAKDTVTDLLGEIYARISAHFALEEHVMKSRRYDQFAEHKRDHERLLDEIRDMMDEHETGSLVNEERLASRLAPWFGEHFRLQDARFHNAGLSGS